MSPLFFNPSAWYPSVIKMLSPLYRGDAVGMTFMRMHALKLANELSDFETAVTISLRPVRRACGGRKVVRA